MCVCVCVCAFWDPDHPSRLGSWIADDIGVALEASAWRDPPPYDLPAVHDPAVHDLAVHESCPPFLFKVFRLDCDAHAVL